MIKKIVSILLVLVSVLSFAACDGKDNNGGNQTETPGQIKGEVYNTGNFSVLVPEEWKVFTVSDMFSDEEDAVDPDALQISKDAEDEWDLFFKPYIRIDYYGPDTSMVEPSKDWYDNVTDLAPVKTGDYTWTGFTCTSMDYPATILWTEKGGHQFQVIIWNGEDDGSISHEDADVQAILASITPAN